MSQSQALFAQAQQHIPGGVNSPVRSFRSVGGTPPFIARGQGPYLIDVDNQRYIDYVGSWGTAVLGHAHPAVVRAVQEAVANGLSFGAPTPGEVHLAEKIRQYYPSIDSIRFVNSGTEATMSAIRLARGATGRSKILKFEGCYHGHSDSLLIKAGSGGLTFGVPSSLGVPVQFIQETCTAIFNNLDSVEQVFQAVGKDIAAIIVEPIAGNMNCVLPLPGFLKGLREICDRYGSLLIIDEVITGFRVAMGGAQQLYGIEADITTLGKIIGGGMPIGAFGGKQSIMDYISPLGPVYQAGTLSGNPVAMAAGLATLTEIENQPAFYHELTSKTERLVSGLTERAKAHGVPFIANYVGGLFGISFTEQHSITCLDDVSRCDNEAFKLFFHAMLKNGFYFAPSAFEAGCMSIAHGMEEIDATLTGVDKVFDQLNNYSQ